MMKMHRKHIPFDLTYVMFLFSVTGSELEPPTPQSQPQVSRCTQTSTAAPDSCCSHTNPVHIKRTSSSKSIYPSNADNLIYQLPPTKQNSSWLLGNFSPIQLDLQWLSRLEFSVLLTHWQGCCYMIWRTSRAVVNCSNQRDNPVPCSCTSEWKYKWLSTKLIETSAIASSCYLTKHCGIKFIYCNAVFSLFCCLQRHTAILSIQYEL